MQPAAAAAREEASALLPPPAGRRRRRPLLGLAAPLLLRPAAGKRLLRSPPMRWRGGRFPLAPSTTLRLRRAAGPVTAPPSQTANVQGAAGREMAAGGGAAHEVCHVLLVPRPAERAPRQRAEVRDPEKPRHESPELGGVAAVRLGDPPDAGPGALRRGLRLHLRRTGADTGDVGARCLRRRGAGRGDAGRKDGCAGARLPDAEGGVLGG